MANALFVLVSALGSFRFANGFLMVHNVPRNVTRTLRVSNGGDFGEWGDPDFCAEGSFAVGYDMKVSPF